MIVSSAQYLYVWIEHIFDGNNVSSARITGIVSNDSKIILVQIDANSHKSTEPHHNF